MTNLFPVLSYQIGFPDLTLTSARLNLRLLIPEPVNRSL